MKYESPSDPLIALPANAPEVLRGVYASIDNLSTASPLKSYMDAPATVWEERTDGHSYPMDAEFNKGEAVKQDIHEAAQAVGEGRIGVVGLVSGSVSGNYAAKTPGGPNLRSAFAHLDELLDDNTLAAPTDFHQMFRSFSAASAGAQIGYLENGADPSSETGEQLIAAASAVLQAGRTMSLNDALGRPDGILMPLKDAGTGSLMPNVFVKVHSGIYSDPNGSGSQAAHLSFASLIVLPKGLLEAQRAQEDLGMNNNIPDAEAIHYLKEGLPEQDVIGGNRKGGSFSDTVRRSAIVEKINPDGSQEGLTHLLIVGGSVLGVVRSLDTDKNLVETRLVLLPIGQQATAYKEGQTNAKNLLILNAADASKPREGGVVQDFEAARLGRDDLKAVFGIKDRFISGKHLEITLTGRGAGVHVQDTQSTNGTSVITMDTYMRQGENGLKGMAHESALALYDTVQKQPRLWQNS